MTAHPHLAVNTALAPVRVVVWGATDADRRRAITNARNHHSLFGRRIAHIEHADEPARATGDTTGLVYAVIDYDRTWAAYRLETGHGEAA